MASATRTVSVNAAFLQEIKADNLELRAILERAEEAFHLPTASRASYKELVEVLANLRDQLAIHFVLEESFGYVDDAIEVAPRLGDLAIALKAEHQKLYMHICDVVENAERLLYHEPAAPNVSRVVAEYKAFRDVFDAHEKAENELIFAAFDDDIGGSD